MPKYCQILWNTGRLKTVDNDLGNLWLLPTNRGPGTWFPSRPAGGRRALSTVCRGFQASRPGCQCNIQNRSWVLFAFCFGRAKLLFGPESKWNQLCSNTKTMCGVSCCRPCRPQTVNSCASTDAMSQETTARCWLKTCCSGLVLVWAEWNTGGGAKLLVFCWINPGERGGSRAECAAQHPAQTWVHLQ